MKQLLCNHLEIREFQKLIFQFGHCNFNQLCQLNPTAMQPLDYGGSAAATRNIASGTQATAKLLARSLRRPIQRLLSFFSFFFNIKYLTNE